MQTGEQLKLAGIARVNLTHKEWIEWIRHMAIKIARHEGQVDTDILRRIADAAGLQPRVSKAWGAICAGKEWVRVGDKKSDYPSNHGRRISIWRYKPTAVEFEQ